MTAPLEASKRHKSADGFFSVDRGAFRCAAVGGLNSAVAYLVMARGTGPDNMTTQWSVHSIEQRTGISRPNAAKAVADLLKRGIWKKVRDGKHPIYEAVPGDQVPGGPFTAKEQETLTAIRGVKALPSAHIAIAEMLIARGLATQPKRGKSEQSFELDEAAISALAEPMAVWLPNALIDGAADEVPPVELLRQTHSLPALRLLIELYAVQFLPNFGGVPRDTLHLEFERTKIGEHGSFIVWGFKQNCKTTIGRSLAGHFLTGQFTREPEGTQLDAGWNASFFPAVKTMTSLGLIEQVGMLLDGDDAEGEIIHPYATRGGEPEGRALADAARIFAQKMLTDGQLRWAGDNGFYPYLVPVQRHIANAAMVEVFRLKYRPHTKATAAWYAQMQETTADYLGRYRALNGASASAIAAA